MSSPTPGPSSLPQPSQSNRLHKDEQGNPAQGQRHPRSSSNSNRQDRYESWPAFRFVEPNPNSPQTDERCLTYCSQSSVGRTKQQPPWCRSICVRKVFKHEMRSVILAHPPRAYDDKKDENGNVVPSVQWNEKIDGPWPLPEEFQPPPEDAQSSAGTSKANFTAAEDLLDLDEHEQLSRDKKKQERRFWEPGYYLFYTKTFQGARSHHFYPIYWDKVITPKQKKELEEFKKWLNQPNHPATSAPLASSSNHHSSPASTPTPGPTPSQPPLPSPPPPQDSTLTHLSSPTSFLSSPLSLFTNTIPDALRPVTRPTSRVLGITVDTVSNGEMKEFFKRIAEKAFTREPWALARETSKRAWEVWKAGPPGSDDSPPPPLPPSMGGSGGTGGGSGN